MVRTVAGLSSLAVTFLIGVFGSDHVCAGTFAAEEIAVLGSADHAHAHPELPPWRPGAAPAVKRFYSSIEYLHRRVKAAPLSVPLVSTGPTENDEGFLVNSGTTILYGAPFAPASGGNDTQNFPGFSGSKLTLGYWLDDEQSIAIEASSFWLQTRTEGFAAGGNSTSIGSAGIRIPLFNTVPYKPGSALDLTTSENGIPVSIPGIISGKVVISNRLNLWGFDATGVFNLYRSPAGELNALAGFRYLDLSECFNLTDYIEGMSGSFVGQSGMVTDQFRTRNQFFGAMFGLRGRASWGPLSAGLTGRLALGSTHQVLNVSGAFQAANFTASSGPQGIFAQPSNSGQRSSNDFAAVPEIEVKLSYEVAPAMRVTLGYDFLYYSQVIRPVEQIDRNLPKGQIFEQGGSTVSYTSPTAQFKKTSFYSHGLSVALALDF